jgi:hypothetical protein
MKERDFGDQGIGFIAQDQTKLGRRQQLLPHPPDKTRAQKLAANALVYPGSSTIPDA